MSYKRIIAGLRHRIAELRRNLDKVREERDEGRAKLRERSGLSIPGTGKVAVAVEGEPGFVIRRRADVQPRGLGGAMPILTLYVCHVCGLRVEVTGDATRGERPRSEGWVNTVVSMARGPEIDVECPACARLATEFRAQIETEMAARWSAFCEGRRAKR